MKFFKILLDKSKILWYNTSKVKGTPQMDKGAVKKLLRGLGFGSEYAGVAQLVER